MVAVHKDHTNSVVACECRPDGVVYVDDNGKICFAKYGTDGWARLNLRHDDPEIPSSKTGGAWAASR